MSGGVLTLSMTLIFVTVPPDVHTCSEDAEHPSSRRRPTLLGGGGAGWEGGGERVGRGWGLGQPVWCFFPQYSQILEDMCACHLGDLK